MAKIERSLDGVLFSEVGSVATDVKSFNNMGLNGSTSYSFRVRAYNLGGYSSYSNVASAVTLNSAPEAKDGTASVISGQTFHGSLVATDRDGDALKFEIVAQPTKGTVVVTNATTGEFTYTPNSGVSGIDSFTFKAFDGALCANVT